MFPFSCKKAKASVADGKMVLSFPDAVTPSVSIIDLNVAEGTTLKLETDKQGLHVIRRSGAGTPEVLAAYTSRDKALKALMAANDGMIRARSTPRAVAGVAGGTTIIQNSSGRGWKIFLVILVLAFLFIFTNVASFIEALVGLSDGPLVSPPYGQTIPLTSAPGGGVAPETLGVPVDADEFLKTNRPGGF